jgi:hypothetical protein
LYFPSCGPDRPGKLSCASLAFAIFDALYSSSLFLRKKECRIIQTVWTDRNLCLPHAPKLAITKYGILL